MDSHDKAMLLCALTVATALVLCVLIYNVRMYHENVMHDDHRPRKLWEKEAE